MDDGPRGSQCPELQDHDCENDHLPGNSEIVRDLLLQLDPYKSMGPDGIHPRILKELADVITKPLSMIFEWSRESREVPADWKLVNIDLIFKKKDPKNYRPVSLTSVSGPGVRYSEFDVSHPKPPPLVGQHTVEILKSMLGYEDDAIEELLRTGAVAQHEVR
ncbi:hypothetical protein BTVI_106395 [Pitangus sulphuratus]|nr:hypothetical protein BTVI_106395 [Pitangus sulphuratus]